MKTSEVEELIEAHFPEDSDETEPGWSEWVEIAYMAEIGEKQSWRTPSEEDKARAVQQVEGLGTVTLIDAFTGEEGGPEAVYLIFQIEFSEGDDAGTNRLYRKDGAYISHDGTHWDGELYEVEPKQKTVTVYDAVPKKRS